MFRLRFLICFKAVSHRIYILCWHSHPSSETDWAPPSDCCGPWVPCHTLSCWLNIHWLHNWKGISKQDRNTTGTLSVLLWASDLAILLCCRKATSSVLNQRNSLVFWKKCSSTQCFLGALTFDSKISFRKWGKRFKIQYFKSTKY